MRFFPLVLTGILAAAPASAITPIDVVSNDRAVVTLKTRSFADTISATVCVDPPEPDASYSPGRLTFTLRSETPDFEVELDSRLFGGRTSTDLRASRELSSAFTIAVVDRAERGPWQSFYNGPLMEIPLEE